VYYFENGTAKEYPARELAYNVPSVTKYVVDKVADFETELLEDD